MAGLIRGMVASQASLEGLQPLQGEEKDAYLARLDDVMSDRAFGDLDETTLFLTGSRRIVSCLPGSETSGKVAAGL